jgi:hypothetical protein
MLYKLFMVDFLGFWGFFKFIFFNYLKQLQQSPFNLDKNTNKFFLKKNQLMKKKNGLILGQT